jgi:hypothetical protein
MRIISKLQKAVLKRSDQTLPLYNDVQRVTNFTDKHLAVNALNMFGLTAAT